MELLIYPRFGQQGGKLQSINDQFGWVSRFSQGSVATLECESKCEKSSRRWCAQWVRMYQLSIDSIQFNSWSATTRWTMVDTTEGTRVDDSTEQCNREERCERINHKLKRASKDSNSYSPMPSSAPHPSFPYPFLFVICHWYCCSLLGHRVELAACSDAVDSMEWICMYKMIVHGHPRPPPPSPDLDHWINQ